MPSLIGYSNEAKQYMGDVLWAGIVFWSTERTCRTPNPLRCIELSILGVCALFFSHAAVFVLAGAGLFLAIEVLLISRRWEFVIPDSSCWLDLDCRAGSGLLSLAAPSASGRRFAPILGSSVCAIPSVDKSPMVPLNAEKLRSSDPWI
jgi:hypothetical protein